MNNNELFKRANLKVQIISKIGLLKTEERLFLKLLEDM